MRASSTAIITGGRFERNTSTNPGGWLRVTSALTMTNVTAISNTNTAAGQDGGAVNALGSLVMVGGLVRGLQPVLRQHDGPQRHDHQRGEQF